MHGQVSCLVGCLACRGSVWTQCMTLLYQSCKVKHYLLKTMYFFVQTRSHREYQCLCPASGAPAPRPARSAVLLLRVEPSTPTSPASVSRRGRSTFVRKTEPERATDHCSPGSHLITTVQLLTGCPHADTDRLKRDRVSDGSGRVPQEGAGRAGRAGAVAVGRDVAS